MSVKLFCPTCKKKLRVPEHLAGRQGICPRCGEALRVPSPDDLPEETATSAAGGPLATEEVSPFTPSARLGAIALGLGLASILVLCVPFVGYAALGLSGVGLLLGLWGLVLSRREGPEGKGLSLAGMVQAPQLPDSPPVNFPLAGVATCLLALALALWPLIR